MILYGKIEFFYCNDFNNLVKIWILFNSFEYFCFCCFNDGMKLLVELQFNLDYESVFVEYFWGFVVIEIDLIEEDYNLDFV